MAILIFCPISHAQDPTALRPDKNSPLAPGDSLFRDTVPFHDQLDLVDVLNKVMNKNSTPRQQANQLNLALMPAMGYSLQTGFAGVISANLGFLLNEDEKERISNILTSITYTEYQQIILPIQADIWTKNDRYNIITDWRYLKYPSSTFGLGGHSDINNGYTINFNYLKLHETLLREVFKNLYTGIGFFYDYFWKVREVNPPAGFITSFQKYGLSQTVTASGIAFRLLLDTRTNQINSENGWYLNIVDRPNLKFLGSDNNWQSLLLEARRYFTLSSHPHTILAFWSYNWFTLSGKPPYLMLPSTGWDDFYNTGRGYIQGRFRGRDMIYFETEGRFQITQNGLLGAVVFANLQSFSKELPKQISSMAPGAGLGLRIKINKFSGANLCVDYGFGTEGSRGISVNLGEVF